MRPFAACSSASFASFSQCSARSIQSALRFASSLVSANCRHASAFRRNWAGSSSTHRLVSSMNGVRKASSVGKVNAALKRKAPPIERGQIFCRTNRSDQPSRLAVARTRLKGPQLFDVIFLYLQNPSPVLSTQVAHALLDEISISY